MKPTHPTQPSPGEMLGELIDLSTGFGVAFLPALLLAIPGIVLVVVPVLVLLLVLAAPFALLAAPFLLVRLLRRRPPRISWSTSPRGRGTHMPRRVGRPAA